MYYLTCSGIGLTGAFKWSESKTCFETGLTRSELKKSQSELTDKKLAYFNENWVIIPNTQEKTGYGTSPVTQKAYVNELSSLPEEITKILEGIIPSTEGMHTHRNNKQEIRNKGESVRGEAETLIALFNQEFSKCYGVTKSRRELIAHRLRVYGLHQLERAVKNLSKTPFYRGKNDRKWEATPDYLFRNDENVDKALNLEVKTVAKKSSLIELIGRGA
jgi:hypothetical protein